jgi:hypothetical protein
MSTTVAPSRTLTALDRCDRCGARAVVHVEHSSWDHHLLFCGHHFNAHEEALSALEAFVVDEREE